MISKYESYPLSHIVSVQAIVSADYIQGLTPAINPHFHEAAWELCVCLGGETLLQKGDCQIALQAGELALVQPDCRHDVSIMAAVLYYRAFRVSRRNRQVRSVEAMLKRSRLVWMSCIWGPMETHWSPGSLSLSMPHSRPAWMATTWGA